MLMVILGMASLGIEMTMFMLTQRRMQAAADAAAVAGALTASVSASVMTAEADAVAAAQGFTAGVNGVTIAVNHPPTSGAHIGDAAAVEVLIAQPQQPVLARLFTAAVFTVHGRGVAISGVGGACAVSLNGSASGAIKLLNNVAINNSQCALSSNSTSPTALILQNNATITGPVTLSGGYQLSNGAHLTGSPIITYAAPTPDPYAGLTLPAAPGCTGQSGNRSSGASSMTPGRFCAGWTFANNAVVTLSPGVYYVDQRMIFGTGVSLIGTGGVTVVINGNYTVSIGSNPTFKLTAPTSGATAGLALVSPSTNTAGVLQNFANNSAMNIVGALYFPRQTVEISNNGLAGSSACTQVIADRIQLDNNMSFQINCTGVGVKPTGGASAKLVE